MKISAISILAIIALIACTLSAKAQKSDYVINYHGDTIKCEIESRMLGKPRYKMIGSDKTAKITTDDIQEYYLAKENQTFRRVYLDDNSFTPVLFLQVIERGKISLYLAITNKSTYNSFTHMSDYSSSEQGYITKNSDYATMLKTSSFTIFMKSKSKRKNVLTEMLLDKQAVYEKFVKDNKFGFDDIRNIVHLYNTGKPFVPTPSKEEQEDASPDYNPGQ